MEIIAIIFSGVSLALSAGVFAYVLAGGRNRPISERKEIAAPVMDERKHREFEKAWQEGIANILAYDLTTARKAGKPDGEE